MIESVYFLVGRYMLFLFCKENEIELQLFISNYTKTKILWYNLEWNQYY